MLRSSPYRPCARLRPPAFYFVCLTLASAAAGCGGNRCATPRHAETTAASHYQVGDSVQVEWQGSWYAATVVALLERDQYRIHYVGWGSEWDENVEAIRIRTEGEVVPPPTENLTPPVEEDASGVIQNSGSPDEPAGV